MTKSFDSLGLSDKVTQAVATAGYTEPTEIQAQAIPHVLQKRDLIGIAQTGTGKTASFVLPMLTLLEKGRARARMPRTLILEPTRELASQVFDNFTKYGVNHKLNVALLIGGVSFVEQNKILDRGADVLIATPGRLLDHFERGRLLMTGVDIFVIDEADRMLDMGFIPDIERICGFLPRRRQTLFFSATMPEEIKRLTKRFLTDPISVEASRQNLTAETISQFLVRSGSKPAEKRATLREQINGAADLNNAIIFCNRKRDVATLERSLKRHGFDAGALHGDMDQQSRTETLTKFRGGGLAILVASDVAARGLDIPDVSHVFNFDVPTHAEDYVHRIGRTGRAGRKGTAITISTSSDKKYIDAIEKLIGQTIGSAPAAASAPAKNAQPTEAKSAPAQSADQTAKSDEPSTETKKPRRRRGGRKNQPSIPQEAVSLDARSEASSKAPSQTPSEAPSKSPAQPSSEAVPSAPEGPAEKRDTSHRNKPTDGQNKPKRNPFGEQAQIPAFLLRSFANSPE